MQYVRKDNTQAEPERCPPGRLPLPVRRELPSIPLDRVSDASSSEYPHCDYWQRQPKARCSRIAGTNDAYAHSATAAYEPNSEGCLHTQIGTQRFQKGTCRAGLSTVSATGALPEESNAVSVGLRVSRGLPSVRVDLSGKHIHGSRGAVKCRAPVLFEEQKRTARA